MKTVTVVISPPAQDNDEISYVFDGKKEDAIEYEMYQNEDWPMTRETIRKFITDQYKFFEVNLVAGLSNVSQ